MNLFSLSAFMFSLIIFSSLLVLASCHYYNLQRKLDPEDSEFLSRVRYIITKKEERTFLDIPKKDRGKFIEEFWNRRDPDPSTEENEFKMEYFDRMEKADELFVSEGKPGWMTDRGRIYILFGPPMDRITYPMGGDPYSRCREIWYYGNFPVVFLDATCTGNYRLVTYDFSSLRSINLMYMHELTKAQARAQQTVRGEAGFFDFDWNIKKTMVNSERVEGIISIIVPYANIWFKEKDDKMETFLDVHIELRNFEGNIAWEHEDFFKIETDEKKLKENKKGTFNIEIPFVLEKDLDKLRQGKNKMYAFIKNRTGGDEQRKVKEFELRK